MEVTTKLCHSIRSQFNEKDLFDNEEMPEPISETVDSTVPELTRDFLPSRALLFGVSNPVRIWVRYSLQQQQKHLNLIMPAYWI